MFRALTVALAATLGWLAGGGPARSVPGPDGRPLAFGASAALVAFVGHDGLMDAPLAAQPAWREGSGRRDAVIVACASEAYLAEPLRAAEIVDRLAHGWRIGAGIEEPSKRPSMRPPWPREAETRAASSG